MIPALLASLVILLPLAAQGPATVAPSVEPTFRTVARLCGVVPPASR